MRSKDLVQTKVVQDFIGNAKYLESNVSKRNALSTVNANSMVTLFLSGFTGSLVSCFLIGSGSWLILPILSGAICLVIALAAIFGLDGERADFREELLNLSFNQRWKENLVAKKPVSIENKKLLLLYCAKTARKFYSPIAWFALLPICQYIVWDKSSDTYTVHSIKSNAWRQKTTMIKYRGTRAVFDDALEKL